MLPEWAGRKAVATPSLPVDPDETSPVPAGGDVDTMETEIVGGEVVGRARADLNATDAVGEATASSLGESPTGGLPQASVTTQTSPPQRTTALLVVLALLALVAGIAAGYVYLMVVG